MDRTIDNMNKNLSSVNIYIGLSKASDSLDHDILLSKLKFYGLSNDALNLLKKNTLLEETMQFVQIGNIKSELHTYNFICNFTGICNGSTTVQYSH